MPSLNPPPPTHAQQAKARLTGLSAMAWSYAVAAQRQGIEALWLNPDATPQEICDELGTDAVAAFDDHARLTDFIVGQLIAEGKNPLDTILLPTFAFTREQDGRVTVSEDPYVP